MKQELDHNTKDDLIASGSTIAALVLIIVLLLAFGLKSIIPPPPPKKTFYVDIAEYAGGGGGGGTPDPTPSTSRQPSGQTYATQNAQSAPSVAPSDKPSTTNSQPAVSTPKPDQSAMYKGRGGTGSGGGSGSGIGSGTGSGLGPGEGGGHGGGIGYGTGTRGMINTINTTVNEEGQVCVEVHVTAEGNVISARVINTSKFKTTITNSQIQAQCIAQAKQARYKAGKEELRVIIFH